MPAWMPSVNPFVAIGVDSLNSIDPPEPWKPT